MFYKKALITKVKFKHYIKKEQDLLRVFYKPCRYLHTLQQQITKCHHIRYNDIHISVFHFVYYSYICNLNFLIELTYVITLMLSRRLFRIKILQIVYAHHLSTEKSLKDSEKELLFSVTKSHELYLLLLQLLVDVAHQANLKAELIENREVTDKSDAVKFHKLANNEVINALSHNRDFQKKISGTKQSWNDNIALVKDFMNQIIESDIYREYLEKESSFKADKAMALSIISDFFPLSEWLFSHIEEKSIYWNDDVDFIMEMVYKTIKNADENDSSKIEILEPFQNDEDREFLITLFRKVITEFNTYTEVIEKSLENWKLDRVAELDLLLIKMAVIEAIECKTIPLKVTLNEYIEIAKSYSTENSGTFINGIIDKLFKQLVNDKIIVKTGRGLIE